MKKFQQKNHRFDEGKHAKNQRKWLIKRELRLREIVDSLDQSLRASDGDAKHMFSMTSPEEMLRSTSQMKSAEAMVQRWPNTAELQRQHITADNALKPTANSIRAPRVTLCTQHTDMPGASIPSDTRPEVLITSDNVSHTARNEDFDGRLTATKQEVETQTLAKTSPSCDIEKRARLPTPQRCASPKHAGVMATVVIKTRATQTNAPPEQGKTKSAKTNHGYGFCGGLVLTLTLLLLSVAVCAVAAGDLVVASQVQPETAATSTSNHPATGTEPHPHAHSSNMLTTLSIMTGLTTTLVAFLK
jgi:hypothetical protein